MNFLYTLIKWIEDCSSSLWGEEINWISERTCNGTIVNQLRKCDSCSNYQKITLSIFLSCSDTWPMTTSINYFFFFPIRLYLNNWVLKLRSKRNEWTDCAIKPAGIMIWKFHFKENKKERKSKRCHSPQQWSLTSMLSYTLV